MTNETTFGAGRRVGAGLVVRAVLVLSLAVALMATTPPSASAQGQPAAPAAGSSSPGGCVDKLVIETPGATASVFGAVTLAPGQTFTATIRLWTSRPTARTWLTGFNSEAKLSVARNGFPADAVATKGLAAGEPWGADGFKDAGVLTYRNPSTSTNTQFILEVGAWNRPASGVIGRTELSGFSHCVSGQSLPARPAVACLTMPVMRADIKDVVRSEPFFMPANARLTLDMMDSRTFGRSTTGHVEQRHGDWSLSVRLYDAVTGALITSRGDASHGFYWTREAYVELDDVNVFNDATAGNVILEMATSVTRGGGLPQTTPIDARVNGTSTCLKTTKPVVVWPAALSCKTDGTNQITATVTNKTTATAQYRIVMIDKATGVARHGSHDHPIGPGQTAPVTLGGIPPGEWLFQVTENGNVLGPSTTLKSAPCGPNVVWPAALSCKTDNTNEITASVTNKTTATANYRIVMIDKATGVARHGSHDHPIGPGQTAPVTLGGIPPGEWLFQVTENGNVLGPSTTLKSAPCGPNVVWPAALSCKTDNTNEITASVTNKTTATANYRIVMIDIATGVARHTTHDHSIGAGQTAPVTLGGIPPGQWLFQVTQNGTALNPSTTLTGGMCSTIAQVAGTKDPIRVQTPWGSVRYVGFKYRLEATTSPNCPAKSVYLEFRLTNVDSSGATLDQIRFFNGRLEPISLSGATSAVINGRMSLSANGFSWSPWLKVDESLASIGGDGDFSWSANSFAFSFDNNNGNPFCSDGPTVQPYPEFPI